MTEEEALRQIDRYLRGELSTNEVDELWLTFLENPAYYELFEAELAARELLAGDVHSGRERWPENREDPELAGEVERQLIGKQRVWLIAMVALLSLALLLRYLTSLNSVDLPDGVWAKIPVDEMVTTRLYRGVETEFNSYDIAINNGFRAASDGEYDEAMEIFNRIRSGQTEGIYYQASTLNYGILLYNREQFEEAAEIFDELLQRESVSLGDHLSGKAWWFIGLSQIRLGQHVEGERSLKLALQYGGIFEEDALRYLSRLNDRVPENPRP